MFTIDNGKVVLLNKLTYKLPLEPNPFVSQRPPVLMAEMAFVYTQHQAILQQTVLQCVGLKGRFKSSINVQMVEKYTETQQGIISIVGLFDRASSP